MGVILCNLCVGVYTSQTLEMRSITTTCPTTFNTLWKTNSERIEAEFLDVIGTKILRVFLLAIHSNLYPMGFNPPPPPGAKVV
jgi:hypothetical protein